MLANTPTLTLLMALKLLIPTIADKLDPAVETRGVYIEEWIEALPYANPSMLVSNLLEAITVLNRNPLKPANRLALMELYAKPYQYLLELQEKHVTSRTVAAFEKHRLDSDGARRVAVEMAYGYKIILAQSVGKKSLFGKNKGVTVAVQRAMLFLSFSLLHSYDEYRPTPRHLWSEMGELYEFAVRSSLAGEAVDADGLREEFAGTPAHVYKRILLTSLVDPYHLKEGDIWRVFAILGGWADEATLGAVKKVEKPAGYFLIDSKHDQRPVGYGSGATNMAGECLMLDATAVVGQLQAAIKEAGANPGERHQLGRVLRALGLPPKRHTPRESTRGTVKLSSGLPTLHHFLSDPDAIIRTTEAEITSNSMEEGIEIGDTTDEVALAGPTYRAEHWDIVDKGPGGVGILKSDRPLVPVSVGELICLGFDLDCDLSNSWSIGVVRWLNVVEDGEYHAGVQLLSRAAQAIKLCIEDAELNAPGYDGLALPRVGGDKSSTLVAPKGCYAKDSLYSVETERGMAKVKAGALVEAAESYDRFSYELA